MDLKRFLIVPLALAAILAGGATRIVQDQCGPFTDVTPGLCPYILEIYYLGITVGTSATTFSPDEPLTRGQGAVFVAKGVNQALARSSRRAALGQWWTTTQPYAGLGLTSVDREPYFCACDGADVWVTSTLPEISGSVSRVRASDGKVLEVWHDALGAENVVVAMGRVFVSASGPVSNNLYMIDPAQPVGSVTVATTSLGPSPIGIAFDGSRIWTANSGSVSIVTPATTFPWPVTTVTSGFGTLTAALFDGNNIWVSNYSAGSLLRLDPSGGILQTVQVGPFPLGIVFDGANIWVASSDSVTVVQVSTGTVLTTLSGGGIAAAFDGQRVLIANSGDGFSMWRSADFTLLGEFSMGDPVLPIGACSDGQNFWVTFKGSSQLARF